MRLPLCVQGWPVYRDSIEIKSGQRLVVTAAEDGSDDANMPRLPVSNPQFVEMCEVTPSLQGSTRAM